MFITPSRIPVRPVEQAYSPKLATARFSSRGDRTLQCRASQGLDPFDSSSIDRFQRYVDAQIQAAERMAQQAEAQAGNAEQYSSNGVTTYRREYSSNNSTANSYSQTYYREVIITSSPPVTTAAAPSFAALPVPFLVITAAVLAAWARATVQFVKNFECTLYQPQRKLLLALVWPLLLIVSGRFRQQFAAALRGKKVVFRDLTEQPEQRQ